MKPLISLQNITKDYGTFRALDDVTLEVHSGVVGLLGPNGAGKSTLIKMLLGMVSIQRGTGTVFGYDIERENRAVRRRAGYMPEDDCYISGLTGVEMVQFTARLSGIPPVESLRRAHEILDFSGTEQERYRQVETYSTGMRQKLKFAQAIVHDPDLLIFDEPTAGLDPSEREVMLRRIRRLHTEHGKAVLISTHILPDVQSICNHVVILAKGKVRLNESMEVLSAPAEPTIHIRVFGDAAPLLAAVAADGKQAKQHFDGSIAIQGIDISNVEQVWKWSHATGVGIRSLKPACNSMEQIFLDAVREEHVASK